MKQKGINTDSVTIDKKDGEESSEEEVKEKKKYLTINETLAQQKTNTLSIKHFRSIVEDEDDRELIDGVD